MAKFNVTKVVPEGFMHHYAFDEVIASLSWSLAALGYDVSTTQNWFSERQETNIVFGCELLADFQRLPPSTIVFNLEQPSHPNMDKMRRIAKESQATVWDYSATACGEWRSAGHDKVIHVPIGYTPNLTRIPAAATQDIDVAFFGWLTPRRIALIDELRRHGLNVYSSASCYGGGRDNIISRSKVVLNVHHDGRDRFEIVRCSYLMANSKCVVTEESSDDNEYKDLNGYYNVNYRTLVDSCVSLCKMDGERRRISEVAFDSIRGRDFTTTVAAALDSLDGGHMVGVSARIVPPDTRGDFHVSRVNTKRDYMAEARDLKKHDARVCARYTAAATSGDMKDFVEWMAEHARGNVVEIGVRDGASTSAFLCGVERNGGHLYSIDVQPCGDLFAGHPQWSFLQRNSTDLQSILRFIPFEIDLLLIDGDHSRAGVISDFEYARQVRAGGLVLFHDIAPEERPSGCRDMSWPGDAVKGVYNELCAALAPLGWTHEELPGRYGMGVLKKPPMTPPPPIQIAEDCELGRDQLN